MRNIKSISMALTADIELLDPKTAEGLGAFFIMAGPNHPARQAHELARERRLRQEVRKRGRVEIGDPEDDRKQEIDYLVACTLGWYSIDPETKERKEYILLGEEVPYSSEAARRVYEDAQLSWIKRQLKSDMRGDEVFLSASSANSPATPSGTSV